MRRALVFCLLAGAASPDAWARGASPYLPLNLSPEMERQIERVLILADRPITSRPAALSARALSVTAMVGDGLMRLSWSARKAMSILRCRGPGVVTVPSRRGNKQRVIDTSTLLMA